MGRYESLRNFCKKNVLVIAIAMSVFMLFTVINFISAVGSTLEIARYTGEIATVVGSIFGGLGGMVMNGLVVLDLWLIFGCKRGGGSITKVIMMINRIMMFIALGLVALMQIVLFIAGIASELPGVVFLGFFACGLLVLVCLFYLFMFCSIGNIAGDVSRRLHTDNTDYTIPYNGRVTLGKYLITLIVFAGLGLIFKIIFAAAVPTYTLQNIIWDFSYELGLDRSLRRSLYEMLYSMVGVSWSSILTSFIMIGVYSCGLVTLGGYKRLVKGE